MIKGIIFDLDNCCFETRSIGKDALLPVALVAGADRADELLEALWQTPLSQVIVEKSLPDYIGNRMLAAFNQLEVQGDITPFPDVSHIRALPQTKILVTLGYNRFQRSKVERLGIADLFAEVHVVSMDDDGKKKSKAPKFQEILRSYGWTPLDVVVVGDNPASELQAGKDLGMITVQSLRPGVRKAEGFNHYITSFEQLPELLKQY